MNAEDIAAERWKPIRQAREEIAKAEARLAVSHTQLEKLRAELPRAEAEDRRALGEAIVAGRSEPKPKAEKLRAELAAEKRRNDALMDAVRQAHGEIGRQVEQNRASWHRDALMELGKAQSRYTDAIAELEAARDALSGEASLCVWVSSGSASVAEAASDPLSGRVGIDAAGKSAMSFSQVLEELRRDAEHLAAHPVEHDEPAGHLAWERIRRAVA
jgi:chromosome segregation ATPase